jgi:hypothetical protein
MAIMWLAVALFRRREIAWCKFIMQVGIVNIEQLRYLFSVNN